MGESHGGAAGTFYSPRSNSPRIRAKHFRLQSPLGKRSGAIRGKKRKQNPNGSSAHGWVDSDVAIDHWSGSRHRGYAVRARGRRLSSASDGGDRGS